MVDARWTWGGGGGGGGGGEGQGAKLQNNTVDYLFESSTTVVVETTLKLTSKKLAFKLSWHVFEYHPSPMSTSHPLTDK